MRAWRRGAGLTEMEGVEEMEVVVRRSGGGGGGGGRATR